MKRSMRAWGSARLVRGRPVPAVAPGAPWPWFRGPAACLRVVFLLAAACTWGCGGSPGGPCDPGSDPGCDAGPGFQPAYPFLFSGSHVQDRNVYLLTLFQHVPEIRGALQADVELRDISTEREAAFRAAAAACSGDPACYEAALVPTVQEAEAVGRTLARLFDPGPVGCLPVQAHMRRSGRFQRFADLSDTEMIRAAWLLSWEGLRGVVDLAAATLVPAELDRVVRQVEAGHPESLLFFEPLLLCALAMLEAEGRDEAGRYEPLAQGENRPAWERIPRIAWDDYPYAVILVPGYGPTSVDQPLSPEGRGRCRLAVERWRDGLAPFLLPSGGHVHPFGTPYCEAIEMKKVLMEEHGVPEDAILIDPYARHTTTNLRNMARTLFQYALPADRDALVTTDIFQNVYIAHLLDARCLNELGYLPYEKVEMISANDSVVRPNIVSLQADPRDPLDP